jgi:hypothetical protein
MYYRLRQPVDGDVAGRHEGAAGIDTGGTVS